MADNNLKPETNIAKTKSKFLAGNTEKHEAVRKNNDRKTNRAKRYTRSASLHLDGISRVYYRH